MNITQLKKDFDNGVLISRATLGELIDYAMGVQVAADEHECGATQGVEIHQWRRRDVDMWHDTTKEDAYSRVDDYYEARTVYLAR